MNQKQILALIRDNPSDENLRIACDWILEKKQTSRETQAVIRELLAQPRFIEYMPMLSTWMAKASWNGLIGAMDTISSVNLFYRIVEILESNPNHPQAGDLWERILQNTRDYKLVFKARLWFLDSCASAKQASTLPLYVMRNLPSQQVIDKARKLLGEAPNDLGILWTLLEFDDYAPAIDRVTSLMKSATTPTDCLIESKALLKNDSARFSPLIEGFIRRFWDHKQLRILIRECLEAAPNELLPLAAEWIDSQKDPKQYLSLMQPNIEKPLSRSTANYLWSWWIERLPPHEIKWSLLRMCEYSEYMDLPDEVISFALSWLGDNKGERGWTHTASTLIRITADRDELRLGKTPLDELDDENCAMIMAAIAAYSTDTASLEIARRWVTKFASRKVSIPVLLELCKRCPDPELITTARTHLPTGDRIHNAEFLGVFIRAHDEAAIEEARQILFEKQIIKRWTSHHHCRGILLLALLESKHHTQEILELATEWVSLTPACYESELHTKMQQALKRAG